MHRSPRACPRSFAASRALAFWYSSCSRSEFDLPKESRYKLAPPLWLSDAPESEPLAAAADSFSLHVS